MNPTFVEGIAFETMKVILIVSAPALFVALVVGLAISILQATTQIQEMTLSYIPKIVSIYVVLILFGGFIMDRLIAFSTGIFSDFSRYAQ